MDSYEKKKTRPWGVAALVLVGLVVAFVVFAAKGDKKNETGVYSKNEPLADGTSQAYKNPDANTVARGPYRGFKATDLLGKSVKNSEGKDLGKIEDLVVSVLTGDVRYAVLSFGGWLGVGDDLYAIPVRDLHPGAANDDLLLDLDKQRLEGARHFGRESWPMDAAYWEEADRVYGIDSGAEPAQSMHAFRASQLVGDNVQNLEKNSVGLIDDLVVDLNGQTIHYAILKTSNEFGDGRLVGVPITAFVISADTHEPILNVTRAKLDGLRHYDSGLWPNVRDEDAMAEIQRGWEEAFPSSHS